MGNDGKAFGNDTSTTQGTSFAAPLVSGVIAVMLEANPNLGYRDVQQILALTSKKVNDPNTDIAWNSATNWNGGGMHTSHDYGFGEVGFAFGGDRTDKSRRWRDGEYPSSKANCWNGEWRAAA